MARITIGMGQMAVRGGQPEDNLARACRMIDAAADRGCDFVVLPECLDLGWTHPSARQQGEPIPGPRSDTLCEAARRRGIYVVAGLTELDGARIYNAAILIDSAGEIRLKHRKINILSIATDLYSIGDRLEVADTPWGTVGVLICADNFPESLCLGHSLARMGARLLLSPCAWAVPPDYDNVAEPYGDLWRGAYTTLTKAYPMTVVGVSNVGPVEDGPWKGYSCIGCSLAMGQGGETLFQAPYGDDAETLHVFTVDHPK